MARESKVKKIVIPLSLFVAILTTVHMLSIIGAMTGDAKEGDIEGITETVTDEIVEETKDKVTEPFWVLLVKNPLIWLLGVIGSIAGIKIVIR